MPPALSFPFARIRRQWLTFLVASILPLTPAAAHNWSANDLKSGPGSSLPGRRPDSLLSLDYLRLLADDTGSILTSPLTWDRQDWQLAGGLTGMVLASAALDHNIKREAQEGRTKELDQFTKKTQRFGAEYSFLVLGGFEAYGYCARDARAKAVALDGVTASIIASGIIVPILKYGVGRARPNVATHTFHFKPFSSNSSFPSGHTTQAFAVASVITAHYAQWWVQGLAYGAAGMVGYSRIVQDAHFASDVVAGAVIGAVIGRAVVRRHDHPSAGGVSVEPYFDGRASGIVLSRDY